MSTLKTLREKITGIQNTQKITKAMQMVATSCAKRAKVSFNNMLPLNQALNDLMFIMQKQEFDFSTWDKISKNLFRGNGEGAPDLYITVTTDKGLCGGYNSTILSELEKIISGNGEEIENNNSRADKNYRLAFIGAKGFELYKNHPKTLSLPVTENMYKSNILDIIDTICDWIKEGKVGKVYILHHVYKSAFSQPVVLTQLSPIADSTYDSQNNKSLKAGYQIEPGANTIMQNLVYDFVYNKLKMVMAENDLCENSARMTAMDAATKNAKEIIKDLNLQYNKTRQAQITNQLIEIISAVQSM